MEKQTNNLDVLVNRYERDELSFAELVQAMQKRIKSIAWGAVRAYERFKPMYDVEDYENHVLLALVKAIEHWDPERASFATFFERVAKYDLNAIRKEMSAQSRQGNLDTFSWEFHLLGGESEGMAEEEYAYSRSEFWQVIDSIDLSPQQSLICQMVCEGYKNKEIATHLGISEAAVSMTLKRLRPKFLEAGLSLAG